MTKTNPETSIVYKTETMSDHGWEERLILPSESITDILWENWSYSGQIPTIGSRIREYTNLENPEKGGVTHGRDGDWVVTKIHQFSCPDTEQRIVVCYCSYQPIEPQWQKLKRGKPLDELVEATS